ncbi:MAG: lipid-A-disaccharide synthase [Bacteroidota bacterium]
MRYYIIAGEASGDLHASNLMRYLRQLDPAASFRCWGGDRMKAQGGELVKHYRELAFMGFTEVLMNLRTILQNIRYCKNDILEHRPDALILVDYPGFNMRIAEFARANGIRVFYYISPQVWAWKQSRVHKIKRTVDRMFVILPFEKDFYRNFGYEVDFVGHPLLDAIEEKEKASFRDFTREHGLSGKPIVALLPGSRRQEIAVMLPVMAALSRKFPDHQFVIAGAPSQPMEFYEGFIRGSGIAVLHDKTYDLLRQASAALVTSGTATLETALFEVPEVVCYKGGAISFLIAKQLVKVKYISLVNLIMDREVVKELVQHDFTEHRLEQELRKLLDPENRDRMKKDLRELKLKLGNAGASARTAELIHNRLIQP